MASQQEVSGRSRLFLFFSQLDGMLVDVLRELTGPLAEFVSIQMVSFFMSGGGGIGMGCQTVQFRRPAVSALGHDLLLTYWMQTADRGP